MLMNTDSGKPRSERSHRQHSWRSLLLLMAVLAWLNGTVAAAEPTVVAIRPAALERLPRSAAASDKLSPTSNAALMASGVELVRNGGFEQDGGWFGENVRLTNEVVASGFRALELDSSEQSFVYQVVAVPANANGGNIGFDRMDNAIMGDDDADKTPLEVCLYDAELTTIHACTTIDRREGMGYKHVDLGLSEALARSLSGQQVALLFVSSANGDLMPPRYMLDNVSFQVSTGTAQQPTAPPQQPTAPPQQPTAPPQQPTQPAPRPVGPVFLPLLASSKATPPTTPPPPTAPPTTPPPGGQGALYPMPTIKTASAAARVDANGVMHTAFVHFVPQADKPAAVYGVCRAGGNGCAQAANWSFVQLTDQANEVQLALTAAGQPRLLVVGDSKVYPAGKDYIYAECNNGCNNGANWEVARVLASDGTGIFDVSDQRAPQNYFALDGQGRPRFVYQDRNYLIEPDHYGAFYVSCESGCTDPQNWTQTQIGYWIPGTGRYEVFSYTSLTFTKAGGPRLIAKLLAQNEDGSEAPDGLYYYACDEGCEQQRNWQRVFLTEVGGGSFPLPAWDMELDANDRPRIALFTGDGTIASGFEAHVLHYLSCDANCMNDSSWSSRSVTVPGEGETPDLELDAQGRPRIAAIFKGALGLLWCDANCSGNAQWQVKIIETPQQMKQGNPQAIPLTCDSDLWKALTPSLALDNGGNPRIAYDVQVDARCRFEDPNNPNGPPVTSFRRIWNGVRLAFLPRP
jgi:hypothetical protein